ncbi:MAG: hypothetical protein ACUVTZ_01005 [Armatimonadota bacterium]
MKGVFAESMGLRIAGLTAQTAIALALATALAGCGGGGRVPIITGVTVSPGTMVTAGTSVRLTATVRDSTAVKQARWTADGGDMAVDVGLTGTWNAPDDITETTVFSITLIVEETTGLRDLATVKVTVSPAGYSTTAVRITGLSVQSSVVKPGGRNVFSVTVANQSNLVGVDWKADKGWFIQNGVSQVEWIAPTDVIDDLWVPITVTVTGTQQEVDSRTFQVLVSGAGYSIITGFQVSGAGAVSQGDVVTATVQVDDTSSVKEVKWTANGGTLSVDKGLTCRWIAPRGMRQDTVYILTARVINNLGLVSEGSVKVIVAGSAP